MESPVIRERRLVHLVKHTLVPAGLEGPDAHAGRCRSGILLGAELLAHRERRPHPDVAARRQQRSPTYVSIGRPGTNAFRASLGREGFPPSQCPGPDPAAQVFRMHADQRVERAAFLDAPDPLRVSRDLGAIQEEPRVSPQVRGRKVPDPGPILPHRIGIQPKGPVGILEDANDDVQIGVDRRAQGVTAGEGMDIRHRKPRA